MDIPQVLAVLRPNEDWGPCAQTDSIYADLLRTWRSTQSACPSEAQMQSTWTQIQASNAAAVALALKMAARPLTIRSGRIPFGPIPAGLTATVDIIWPTPFVDTDYSPFVAIVCSDAAITYAITAKTATGVTLQLRNMTGILLGLLGKSLSGTINVSGVHD